MTTLDITPDDDPLDAAAVVADDALVERLRRATTPQDAVVWDDDDDLDDPGYALLLALTRDVSVGIPDEDLILPVGVTPLMPRRRRLTRGAAVGLVAAGVLSVGTAAAAAPGQPLSGVRSAVASAVTSVVDAITPSEPVGPTGAQTGASPRPTPPGVVVSAAARDAAAVTQIRANLDRAATLLRAGHDAAAKHQLDAAGRKLDLVKDVDVHAALAAELAALRSQLAAPHPTATHPSSSHKPVARDDHGRAPATQPSARANDTRSHAPAVAPTAKTRSAGHPGAATAPRGVVGSHADPR
jgi:hypothetical protein